MFSEIFLGPRDRAIFWSCGHYLNNLGRGCIPNIKALGLVVFLDMATENI